MALMTYLWKHKKTGVYWFNRAVPEELQSAVGKTKISKTLRTKNPTEAKRLGHEMALEVEKLFASAREGVAIDGATARAMAEAWKAQELSDLEDTLIQSDREEDIDSASSAITEGMEQVDSGIVTRRWPSRIRNVVKATLADQGLAVSESNPAFARLALEFSRAALEVDRAHLKRLEGEWWGEGDSAPRPVIAPALSPLALRSPRSRVADAGPTLNEVFDKWAAERKPDPKTLHEWRRAIRRFGEVAGEDLPVRAITKAHVRDYKDALLQLPRVLTREQQRTPIPKLLASLGDTASTQRVSVTTVKKTIGALASVLEWAEGNDYCDANPARGMKIADPDANREKRKRLPYSPEDLKTIFERSPLYTGCASPAHRSKPGNNIIRDVSYWLPLLGLFTGCRLEELGQLLLTDVREEDGIPFLDINTLDEGKRTKNKGSRRKVPLHPELVRCGFLDYVAGLRKAGERQLFPELKRDSRGKMTHRWSKWWGRYTDTLGLDDDRKVFHSFRHGFIDMGRKARVPEEVRDRLTGHSNGSIGRTYGEGTPLDVLADAIRSLSFPVNLAHCYNS